MSNLLRRGECFLIIAAVGLGCGGGGPHDQRAPRSFRSRALVSGTVTGVVIDDETGMPVADAEVDVGGRAVRSRADGSFESPAPAGRARVEVRSPGFLQTTRDVAVGEAMLKLPFKLARRAPPQMVGTGGGTVRSREASLEVPAGAVGDGTAISLTFLARVRIAAIAATPQFIDNANIPRRVLASVDVECSAPPAMPMRVRVPVPLDATADSVSGFAMDDKGQWSEPILPDLVAAGFAEFLVSGNARFGVAVDARRADGRRVAYLVAEAGDAAMAGGDVIAGGTEVVAGSRAAAVVDPAGSRVEIPPGSRVRLEPPAEESPPAEGSSGRRAGAAPFAGEAVVAAGRARVLVPAGKPGVPGNIKLTVSGGAASFDVRGTAFTVTSCDGVDNLEVVEGTVEAHFDGKLQKIEKGESATFCTSCLAGVPPVCGAGGDAGMDVGQSPPPVDAARPMDTTAALDSVSPDGGTPGRDVGVEGGATRIDAVTPPALDSAPPPPEDGPPSPPAVDSAVAPPPDLGSPPPPDTGSPPPPDAAPPADDGPPPVDGPALPPPDTAPPPPDMAPPPPPDTAPPPPPDTAPPPPDTMPPADDAGVQPLDAAFVGPVLDINPRSLFAGTMDVGKPSAPMSFMVKNTGDQVSGAVSAVVIGVDAQDFHIAGTDCAQPLAPGAICVVSIVFTPSSPGGKAADLEVSANPGGFVSAALNGTGVTPAPAMLVINPPQYDFGQVPRSMPSAPVTFTIANTGTMASGPVTVSLEGTAKADYIIDADGCKTDLQPQQSCDVMLHLAPLGPGTLDAFLRASSPASTAQAPLTGTGT